MINYTWLGRSVQYYKQNGYLPIDVPWIVSYDVIKTTIPNDKNGTLLKDGRCLVGSAEQGFLYLIKYQNLKGKFQAISPCFRDDKEDEFHKEYFIKNELFCNENVCKENLYAMLDCAFYMFSQLIKVKKIKISENEYDIVDEKFKIELGSYGIRTTNEFGSWIYGTGLAEPRLSLVRSKNKLKNSI